MLWTDKYAPKSLAEVIGQPEAVTRVREWAEAWKNGKRQQPLLLCGKTGCGKTALAVALAAEFDFELFETNASDARDAQSVQRVIGNAAVSRTLFGKQRLLLIDEADGFHGNEDRGGMKEAVHALKSAACPVVLTVNDAWDPKMASLRSACELVKLGKLTVREMRGALQRIAKAEGISVDGEALDLLVDKCKGDLRAAINDLQAIASGKSELAAEDFALLSERDKEEEMFQALRVILKTLDFHESRKAFNALDEEPSFILKWVEENMPREYVDAEDLCRGFEKLSRADGFLARTRKRQSFVLWKYASDLMSAGVSLSKTKRYGAFVKYGFPSTISFLSRSKVERGARGRVGQKIASRCHVSVRRAVNEHLPLVQSAVAGDQAGQVAAEFGFDADDLEFLGVQEPAAVLKEAAVLRAKSAASRPVSEWF